MLWNPTAPPDQGGRTYVVTGSSAGIGYFAAEQLAGAGAHVVLASRSSAKLDAARSSIRAQVTGAEVSTVVVDLASLESVTRAASEIAAYGRIDGVFLNGGAMEWTAGATTVDGLPMMLGTHTVANVALATRLLPALASAGEETGSPSRLVHASTGFVRRFRVEIDDVSATTRGFLRSYTHAKTVTEIYAFELERRLRAAGMPVSSIVTHPGIGVDAKTPARSGVYDPRTQRRRNPFTPWAQGKDTAAWSAVRALTDPDVPGGASIGPRDGRRGEPILLTPNTHTALPGAARAARTWAQLEALTGVPAVV
jgi:NAD(P)-dependent dehydrogenase (short-subunit alcohol dehydrogenase family)